MTENEATPKQPRRRGRPPALDASSVQRVKELHEQNFSNREIARMFNVSEGTVRRALRDAEMSDPERTNDDDSV